MFSWIMGYNGKIMYTWRHNGITWGYDKPKNPFPRSYETARNQGKK